ncbi:DUF6894 family protein [Microvirga sp.]|uniref:DUF6894 family protein n=1 Tax=Microvirga sp. TaxID=1873136 RepID=UPI001FEDCEA2|nr:hypothetical protein [Microvirga sp.]
MPRFFFDTYDSDRLILDDEGLELEDLEAVKREAPKPPCRTWPGTGSLMGTSASSSSA